MSDLIRREDAINALVNLTCYGIEEMRNLCESSVADSEGWLGGIRDAVDEIDALPSAEPERHRGEWIDGMSYVNSHWRVCSVCHESAPDSCGGYKFCPNCGADMRGE